jgi:dipeptidyl aminopeptidase/acylaminoacyl peptidase
MIILPLLAILAQAQGPAAAAAAATRVLTVDDLFRIQRVSDPRVSPDGRWVAYVVSTPDLAADKSTSRIWMVATAGGAPIPLTTKGSSASSPRWSPDGKYLGFLATRGEDAESQVWLLNRLGGEAEQLTTVKQGVSSFVWSPDGARLALEIDDATPEQAGDTTWIGTKAKTQRPFVIDRLQFKRDGTGYLDRRRTHIYVFDVATRAAARQITSGAWDDDGPTWSPDGRLLAFTSNRDSVDGNDNSDIWVVASDDTTKGTTTRRITSEPGPDDNPAWSPDGKSIAYSRQPSAAPIALIYDPSHIAVIAVDGGDGGDGGGARPRPLTATLDRDIRAVRWAADGKSLYGILEDAGDTHLVRVDATSGAVTRLVGEARSVSSYSLGADGTIAALVSEPQLPNEVFVVEAAGLRRLTRTNQPLLDSLRLAEVREIHFKSRDGTVVEAFMYLPLDYQQGRRYPTLLRIHGGPVSSYDRSFNSEAQLFAAHGYAVVMTNPRGSSGYGAKFSRAIFADWGNKDYDDVMAAVDEAVRLGIADPARLGVGGWSYGGILTNYVITKTGRFKAAISGASEALYTSNYGHDHYQNLWEIELGLPWTNQRAWDRISPFWSVAKITTPTLWMGGDRDWNVPIMNSEQMYQAMRRLGRTTQLVVYPGQAHGISKPTYQKDRWRRYLEWYDRFLKP